MTGDFLSNLSLLFQESALHSIYEGEPFVPMTLGNLGNSMTYGTFQSIETATTTTLARGLKFYMCCSSSLCSSHM